MLTIEVAIVEAAAFIAGAHVLVRVIDLIEHRLSNYWADQHEKLSQEYENAKSSFEQELGKLKAKIDSLEGKKNA